MNLKPMGKNILLEKRPEEEKKGVLIVPLMTSKPLVCNVLGVGEKVELSLSEGDVIMLTPHSGFEIEFEDRKYLMVTERDIMARIG